MLKNMSQLGQRFIMSSLVITLLCVIISLSHYFYLKPLFVLGTASIIAAAVWEYYHIAKAKELSPLDTIGIMYTLLYVFGVFASTQSAEAAVLPQIILGLTLLTVFLYYFFGGPNPFVNLAVTLFGIGYLAIPLSCAVNINYFFTEESGQDGRLWLFYLLLVTKITDAVAYFMGKQFGQHKLSPHISPMKTWEGAIGGFFAAVITSACFATLTPIGLSLQQSIGLGSAIGFLAQIGDLSESLLKRDVGVKDSNQIPGLGGMLDMVDSAVFTTPLVYLFLRMQ